MGGKSTTSQQSVSVPPQVLAAYQSTVGRAQQTANNPFVSYGGQFVAPVNTQQNLGISGVNTAANEAQPYFGAATSAINSAQSGVNPVNASALGLAGQSAEQVNAQQIGPQQINQFLSPYLGTVLGSTEQLLSQQNQQAQSGALGTAIQSGAFGGDRTGIAAANLQQQQDLGAGNVYANIANQGFNTALGAAQQQQGVNLGAAQANRAALANAAGLEAGIGQTAYGEQANTANTLATLGAGAQTAGLQGSQAQIGAGTLQQQTQQAQDAALYNQFLQKQSYPFQVDQFLANIVEGTGALSGSTTTTTQPGGFFSDRRLKHDIKKIGKTYDGQHIYSYKHHGDPRTHVGLIAQDVEKKHPGAVGLAAGYKTVEYGKATEKAASKGHFADGGNVVPIRKGLAYGGSPELADILRAQASMYGAPAQGQYGLAAGDVPRGGSSRVPAPVSQPGHLMVAGGLNRQPTGLENANTLATTANQYAKLYHAFSNPSSTPPADNGIQIGSAESDDSPIFRSRGGLAYAVGGTPYANDPALTSLGTAGIGIPIASSTRPMFEDGGEVPTSLDIPNDPSNRSLQQAPPLQSQSSPFSDILKLAGTAAETYGAYAALAAAARGGRINKDVGGSGTADDPYTMDEQTVTADRPPPVNYLEGSDPVDKPPIDVQTPDKAPGLGGAVASSQDTPWYKKSENVIPLLTGLAAMGTAPTRHLGVALAAGLGAGTQAYLPTQEQKADIALKQAQAGMAQTRLGIMQGAMNQPPAGAGQQPQEPTLAGTGMDPSSVVANVQKRFAFMDIYTPQEQANIARQSQLQQAGMPNTLQSILAQHTARMQNQKTMYEQAASRNYDLAYEAANAPAGTALSKVRELDPLAAKQIAEASNDPREQDQMARVWASHTGGTIHKYSGRPVDDKNPDRVPRDALTTNPLLNGTPGGMSPEEQANAMTKLYGSTVDVGANAKPTPASVMRGQGVTPPVGGRPVAPGSPGSTPPATSTAAPATMPARRSATAATPAAPPATTASNGNFDFSDAPNKPSYIDNPHAVLSDDEKDASHDYQATKTALQKDAGKFTDTQKQIADAKRVLNLLPNAMVGPGTKELTAVQTVLGNITGSQLSNLFNNNPSARAIIEKSLANTALLQRLEEMREQGAQVRLGANESNLIVNKLSPSPEMPKEAVQALIGWHLQELNWENQRQQAITPYLKQGKSAVEFDRYYGQTKNPISSALSTEAPAGATLPKRPGQQTSGPVTKVIDGKTYTRQGTKWYAE